MTHLPYEEWILTTEPLTSEQQLALQEHLTACTECQRLSHGIQQTEVLFTQTPQVAPAAGFTQRWKMRHAMERARRIRQINTFILIFLGLGTLTATVIWGFALFAAGYTPASLLAQTVILLTEAVTYFRGMQFFLSSYVETIPLPLAIFVTLNLLVGGSIISLIWLFSIVRLQKNYRS